jgi:hypothetical protein
MAVALTISKSDTASHTEAVGRVRISLVSKTDSAQLSESVSMAVSAPPVTPRSATVNDTLTVTEQVLAGVWERAITYRIACPKCGLNNDVQNMIGTSFQWYCAYCDNTDQGVITYNVTSIPTEADLQTPIFDPLRASSIKLVGWIHL